MFEIDKKHYGSNFNVNRGDEFSELIMKSAEIE